MGRQRSVSPERDGKNNGEFDQLLEVSELQSFGRLKDRWREPQARGGEFEAWAPMARASQRFADAVGLFSPGCWLDCRGGLDLRRNVVNAPGVIGVVFSSRPETLS
jgi:hypothetical protein